MKTIDINGIKVKHNEGVIYMPLNQVDLEKIIKGLASGDVDGYTSNLIENLIEAKLALK